MNNAFTMNLHCRVHGLRARSDSAFSLIEIMAVLAVVSLLAVMSVPALSGLSGPRIQQSVGQVASLLGTARSLAVTQNTFVYVFLRSDAGRVQMLIASSQSGLDVFQDTSGTLDLQQTSQLRLVQPPVSLDQIRLVPEGAVPAGHVIRPQTANTAGLGRDYKLTYKNQTFDRAVVFRPTGEAAQPQSDGARASLGFAGLVEFGMEPTLPSGVEGASPLAAVLQIAGSTGQVKVYRAQSAP